MAIIPPTFPYPLNTTETLCTDDPEDEEYTPAEESTSLASADESNISYSDYTVTVTMRNTSTSMVSNTAIVQAAATSGNGSFAMTTTFTSSMASTAQTDISESITNSNSTMKVGPAAIYTPIESSEMSTQSYDPASIPSTTRSKRKLPSETSSQTPTITNSSSTTSYCSPTDDSSQETIPGTTITYVDETTTIMADQSTSTVTEMASATNAADSTSTTTLWMTSTIITDVNIKLRRRILVTRRGG